MDWVLTYYELLIRLKQWRRLFEIWIHWHSHFFDCGGDFHQRGFKYPVPEIPRSCRYFLSYATLIALSQPYFVICHS